jgi:hypothetical protein
MEENLFFNFKFYFFYTFIFPSNCRSTLVSAAAINFTHPCVDIDVLFNDEKTKQSIEGPSVAKQTYKLSKQREK